MSIRTWLVQRLDKPVPQAHRDTPMSIRTWLVQRLDKPVPQAHRDTPLGRAANAFAFGGGLINGGFSNEAMDLLSNVFQFDYMGAAEYEFGDVPKAVSRLIELRKADKLVSMKVEVAGSRVKDKHTIVPAKHSVWFFCEDDADMKQHCRDWVKHQINGTDTGQWKTRDWTNVKRVLNPDKHQAACNYELRTIGGLALGDHPFCYFFNQEAAEKMALIIDVKIEV